MHKIITKPTYRTMFLLLLLCTISACSSSSSKTSQTTTTTTVNSGDNSFSKSDLFESDFETEKQSCWSTRNEPDNLWNLPGCGGFINIGKGKSVALAENEISHSGTKSLKVTFNNDEDYGGAEVQFPESEHVYTRYYDYYNTDFDFAYGMKVHRIRSFNEKEQINNYDTVMLAWGQPSSGEYNLSGVNDMRLLSINYNGGTSDWGSSESSFSFTRNVWHCVETEMKLNTFGKSDGEVRIWVDGTLQVERTGINIKGTKNNNLNLVLFGGWYSNGALGENPQKDPAVSSIRYIDDIAVSTKRIGCMR